jgi:hypothetical protein
MGEEIQGLDPGFLKLGKIQGLDPRLMTTVNSIVNVVVYTPLLWELYLK